MQDLYPDDLERRREVAIDRYVLAFDRGDLDTMAVVLTQAIDDLELDRRLTAVDAALYTETGLQNVAEQEHVVRRLAYQHVPSGFPTPDEPVRAVTIGEVASQLKIANAQGRPLLTGDVVVNERLLASDVTVPTPVTMTVVARLVNALHLTASDRYLESFRRAAVMLAMARQRDQTQRTAARRTTPPRSTWRGEHSRPSDERGEEL